MNTSDDRGYSSSTQRNQRGRQSFLPPIRNSFRTLSDKANELWPVLPTSTFLIVPG